MEKINDILLPWIPYFHEDEHGRLEFDKYPDPFNPWNGLADPLSERTESGDLINPLQDQLDICFSQIEVCLLFLYKMPFRHETSVYREVVTNREELFKNGRRRKKPILETEYRHVHYDTRTEYEKEVASEALTLAVIQQLQDAAKLTRHGGMKSWLSARHRVITHMLFRPHLRAVVTLHRSSIPGQGYATRVQWDPEDGGPNALYRGLFLKECLQFFTPEMLKMAADELTNFKFVFHKGFCTELHCPRWYWDRMRFRLQYISIIRLTYEYSDIDGRRIRQAVRSWDNEPFQPLRKVILTDAPYLPPIVPVCITSGEVRPEMGKLPVSENLHLIAPYLPRIVRINSTDPDLTKPDGEGNMSLSSDPNPPGASECDSSQPSPPCSPPSVGLPASSAILPPPGVGPSSGPSGPA